jgi:hypothetical protein
MSQIVFGQFSRISALWCLVSHKVRLVNHNFEVHYMILKNYMTCKITQ